MDEGEANPDELSGQSSGTEEIVTRKRISKPRSRLITKKKSSKKKSKKSVEQQNSSSNSDNDPKLSKKNIQQHSDDDESDSGSKKKKNLKLSNEDFLLLMEKMVELDGNLEPSIDALHQEEKLLEVENTATTREKLRRKIRPYVLGKRQPYSIKPFPKSPQKKYTKARWETKEKEIEAIVAKILNAADSLKNKEIFIDATSEKTGEELSAEIRDETDLRNKVADQIKKIRNAPMQKLTEVVFELAKVNVKIQSEMSHLSTNLLQLVATEKFVNNLKVMKLQKEIGVEVVGLPPELLIPPVVPPIHHPQLENPPVVISDKE
jgi:hypothetical protein